MAYALIDNSTLTSVQRILGKIPIRSKEIVDSDISAFENLIQAILFYDDLIAIDDYKKDYREKRKKDFDFIRFIDRTTINLNRFEEEANQELERFVPKIRGGKIEEENLKSLFELLKIIEKDLEKALNDIKSKYSIQIKSGIHILPLIKVINSISPIKCPELDITIGVPEMIKRCWNKNSTATIYRNIAKDLSCIPQLGGTYELITKNLRVNPNKTAMSLKIEDPKYLHTKSDWKIPM